MLISKCSLFNYFLLEAKYLQYLTLLSLHTITVLSLTTVYIVSEVTVL